MRCNDGVYPDISGAQHDVRERGTLALSTNNRQPSPEPAEFNSTSRTTPPVNLIVSDKSQG